VDVAGDGADAHQLAEALGHRDLRHLLRRPARNVLLPPDKPAVVFDVVALRVALAALPLPHVDARVNDCKLVRLVEAAIQGGIDRPSLRYAFKILHSRHKPAIPVNVF